MTPRWRGHCFCCMTLFGLLTFLLSVKNSRRRFTTESESDHCERRTEFCLLTFFLSFENSPRRFTTESESDHCERKTEFVSYSSVNWNYSVDTAM
jgi:hypothetical protein